IPADLDLGLVRPAPAELALRSDQDGAGLRVDEELGDIGGPREPVGVALHDLDDVRGLAFDRDLPRPGERRPATLARLRGRPPVDVDLLLFELPEDRSREHALDEDVLLEDEVLPGRRAEALKDPARLVRPLGPGEGTDDRFHVADALDAIAMPVRPV